MSHRHSPLHPGIVLSEYLPENLSLTETAHKLGVTRQTLSAILNGHSGISAEMALRLSRALGTTPEMWLSMQSTYDLWKASQNPPSNVTRIAA